jgi:hypothetical protein
MVMPNYPDYVQRMLLQARDVGQYYCGQADGATLCYNILTDFPDCTEASELIYELFCDEWTIYDNRIALQRIIDEWDDQPHQQRRRLARSFGFMSRLRWEQEDQESEQDDEIPFEDEDAPLTREEEPETKQLLSQGKMQLLEAYCLGDDEATEYAWPRFMRAIQIARDPQRIRMAVAKQYADLGFFADAVELLLEYLSYQDSRPARRLLAEVGWWRDNAYRIPWIPPPGAGSRHDRLIKLIDPEAPTRQEYLDYVRGHLKEIGKTPTWEPVITSELKELFHEALPNETHPPVKSLVDWSFLDQEDGASTEIAEWVYKDIRRYAKHIENFEQETLKMHKFTRPIKPPASEPKRDPRDERIGDEDEIDDEEFWDELNDELAGDDSEE